MGPVAEEGPPRKPVKLTPTTSPRPAGSCATPPPTLWTHATAARGYSRYTSPSRAGHTSPSLPAR
jgi:hypothetical protein